MAKRSNIIRFPDERRLEWNGPRYKADKNAVIVILPVVRVDRLLKAPQLPPARKNDEGGDAA